MDPLVDGVGAKRAAFFRRTRVLTGVLYAVLALVSLGLGIAALAGDAVVGAVAWTVTLLAAAALFALSARVPATASLARNLLWLAPVAGVLFANVVDVGGWLPPAAWLGGFGGFFGGMGVGIALVRRRLARDDDLIRRQERLGFDLERPWGWLSGRRPS